MGRSSRLNTTPILAHHTDYIQSDEYACLFEQCFRGAAENYQREKIEAFRGILVNSPIRTDIGQEEKEYFLAW